MGALYSLLTEEQKTLFLEKINAISDEVHVIPQETCKQGIGGIHMKVEINGEEEDVEHMHEHHDHREMHEHTHEHSHCAEHTHEEVHVHTHEDDHVHEHAHEDAHVHTHEDGHVHDHHEDAHTHEHTHDHHHEDGHMHAHHHGHHAHTSVASILEKISTLDMSDTVKKHAEGIYRAIAAAESTVHRTDMEQIHFHEVGSVDALIDVVRQQLLPLRCLAWMRFRLHRFVWEMVPSVVHTVYFRFRLRQPLRSLKACRYIAAALTENY